MIRVTKRFYSMPKPIFHMLRRIALVVHCACQCVRFLIASPWCTVVFHTYRIVVFLLATSRTHRSIPRPSTGSRERASEKAECVYAMVLCLCVPAKQFSPSTHCIYLSIHPSIHLVVDASSSSSPLPPCLPDWRLIVHHNLYRIATYIVFVVYANSSKE
jgi:hypothetical protein